MASSPQPELQPLPQPGAYFLSHSGADMQTARRLAEALRARGIAVWLDDDHLTGGDRWPDALEQAIKQAAGMLVLVGSGGVARWVEREVRYGLVRNTEAPDKFPLIPVLADGADLTQLPAFLQQHHCLDWRATADPAAAMDRIVQRLRETTHPAILDGYFTRPDPKTGKPRSPFRGLTTFQPEDSWLFFGRDAETDRLLDTLAKAPLATVIGNSGSGKSSLVRAGLIPALERGRAPEGATWGQWRIAMFRPGGRPFEELAESLPQLSPGMGDADEMTFVDWCKQNATSSTWLDTALARALRGTPDGTRVLLVADQLEELFTLTPDKPTQARYLETLLNAARGHGTHPVHLVMTIRADFVGHCLDHQALNQRFAQNLFTIPRIAAPQLREAMERRFLLSGCRPAPGLMATLLDDAGDEPGNLALLEHALDQLWQQNGGPGREITVEHYRQMEGLEGALRKHADAIIQPFLGTEDEKLVAQIFTELVHLGEGAQDTRRRFARADLERLGPVEHVDRILTKLADGRLITTGDNPQAPVVEVAHESLIRTWTQLRTWLHTNRDDIRFGRALLADAVEWKAGRGQLLQGVKLSRAEEWLAANLAAREEVRELIAASVRERGRSRRLKQALMVGLVPALLVVSALAIGFRHEQMRAESRQLAAQVESTIATDRIGALHLALKAWALAHTEEARVSVGHAAVSYLQLNGHTAQLNSSAFSRDGMRVVTASYDGTARVWDTTTGRQISELRGHKGVTLKAVFAVGDSRVATVGEDRTARIWDTATGKQIAQLEGHIGPIHQIAVSPEGNRFATASEDRTVRVWDAVNSDQIAVLRGHQGGVVSVAFSSDNSRLVTSSFDKTSAVWNSTTGEQLAKLQGHQDAVFSAAFSPDGTRVVTAGRDHTARVWSSTNGKQLALLVGHANFVVTAVFSPNGRRVLTASEDGTARVWDVESGTQLLVLHGHSNGLIRAEYASDGTRILTASLDQTARVWDASSGALVAELRGHSSGIADATLSRDGRRVVTAGLDKVARVWNSDVPRQIAELKGHTQQIIRAQFSRDGRLVLTASADGTARVWDAPSGRALVLLRGHTAGVLDATFSPDETRVLTASLDGTASLWNAATGARLSTLPGHTPALMSADFSRNGTRVVATGGDGIARVWDSTSGVQLATFGSRLEPIVAAGLSPDGLKLATGGDKAVKLWDVAAGKQLVVLSGHRAMVNRVAYSQSGREVLTESQDGAAIVWDPATGQQLRFATAEDRHYLERAARYRVGDLAIDVHYDYARIVKDFTWRDLMEALN